MVKTALDPNDTTHGFNVADLRSELGGTDLGVPREMVIPSNRSPGQVFATIGESEITRRPTVTLTIPGELGGSTTIFWVIDRDKCGEQALNRLVEHHLGRGVTQNDSDRLAALKTALDNIEAK